MESTSEPRDLPVLDAVVRYFDEHPQGQGVMLTCRQVASLAGLDSTDVYRALKRLEPTYVRLVEGLTREASGCSVAGVTDAARHAVRQGRSAVMSGVSLEPEQEELLKILVEAWRNVQREQREQFLLTIDGGGTHILHPGLPGREMRVPDGDIETLEGEGLLNVTDYQRWSRSFILTPLASSLYKELQDRSGAPARQVEDKVMRYLDADAFQRSYPEAYRKWAEAAELLSASDSQKQLTTIGFLCREAIQEFATALVKRHHPDGVETDPTHDVQRVTAVLKQHAARLGTVEPLLRALVTYWATASALVQRQVHGAQKEGRPLIFEDGRRVVFQTAIVMFEVDRALT